MLNLTGGSNQSAVVGCSVHGLRAFCNHTSRLKMVLRVVTLARDEHDVSVLGGRGAHVISSSIFREVSHLLGHVGLHATFCLS